MFKVAFLSVFAFGAAGAAYAQDAAPAPASDWSGPYAGIHAGYGFDDGRKVDIAGTGAGTSTAIANGSRPNVLNQNREGFVGGGQVGWNFQRGAWVFGPEADFSYMHSRGTDAVFTPNTTGTVQGTRVNSRMDWMGSARLRAGHTLGNGLIYGTGGYAYGKVKGDAIFYSPTGAANYAGGHSYTAQGWTAGGGFEFKPIHDSKLSFGVEATYYDLGRSHIIANPQTAALAGTGSYVVGTNTRGFNGVVKVNYGF